MKTKKTTSIYFKPTIIAIGRDVSRVATIEYDIKITSYYLLCFALVIFEYKRG